MDTLNKGDDDDDDGGGAADDDDDERPDNCVHICISQYAML
jgi:hypothetical protein